MRFVDLGAVDRSRDADRRGVRRRAVGRLDRRRAAAPAPGLQEALRVRHRVAASAVRESEHVGRSAELLDDLERCGLLSFDPIRVRRVDDDGALALGELLCCRERVVEGALDLDAGARRPRAPVRASSCAGAACRVHDDGLDPCPCRVRRRRCGRVPGRCADDRRALRPRPLSRPRGPCPRSLNEPVGLAPSHLSQTSTPGPAESRSARSSGVEPSPSVTIGVDGDDRQRVAVALEQRGSQVKSLVR